MSPEDIDLVYDLKDLSMNSIASEINTAVTVVTGVSAFANIHDLEACALPKHVWVMFSGAAVPESLPFVRAERYALR